MAAIGGYSTCLLQKNCRIVGVGRVNNTDASTKDLIITTQQSVAVIKENDTEPCQIWTNKPSQPFTCAAVCDSTTNHYAAACMDHTLLIWDSTTSDITKLKPVKVEGSIQRLFQLESGGCAILYSDGAVYSTTMDAIPKVVRVARKGRIGSDEKICDSCMWSCRRGVYIVCLVAESERYSLCLIPVPDVDQSDKDQTPMMRIALDTPASTSNHRLHHASFCTTGDDLVMYFLWTDGQLYKCSVSHQDLSDCKDQPCSHMLSLTTNIKDTSQIKVASVSSSIVAVIGLQGDSEDHLCLYDTKYGTLIAKQPLRNAAEKTPVLVSNIRYEANHLWVSTNQGVVSLRIDCNESVPLSMALGKQGVSEEERRGKTIMWNVEDWQEDTQDDAMDTSETNQSEGQTILEEIMNQKKVKTANQFNSSVTKWLANEYYLSSVDMSIAQQKVIMYVCQRHSKEKKFWPSDGLSSIIQKGLMSASSCEEFLNIIMEKNDSGLLVQCLKHMQDFPDALLAKIIQFILSNVAIDPKTSENGDGVLDFPMTECPISTETADFLDLVLRYPMNDVFMLECLTKINFQQIMVLLRYLLFLLHSINTAAEEDKIKLPANVVIDWVMLILDAHYSQLVLSTEARALLLRLHQIVGSLSQYFDEVETVHNILTEFSSIAYVTEAPKTSKNEGIYSIEILKL